MSIDRRIAQRLGAVLLALTTLIGATSLHGSLSSFEVRPDLEVLVDENDSLTSQTALVASEWVPVIGSPSLGYIDSPVWLRGDVPAEADVLTIHNMWLKDLTVIFLRGDEEIARYVTGSAHPFDTRPLANAIFSFPIPTDANADGFLIRDYSDTGLFFPIALRDWAAYQESSVRHYLFVGLYLGLMLLLVAYNAALYASTRERLYLLFTGYIVSLTVFLLTSDGVGQEYLWPQWPLVQVYLVSLSILGTAVFLTYFALEFLQVKQHAPWLVRPCQLLLALFAINSLFAQTTEWKLPSLLEPALALTAVLMMLTIGIVRARQGERFALIFLIANGAFMIGVVLVSLLVLGIAPENWLTRNSVRLGSMAEVMLLAIAIAVRLREVNASHTRLEHRARTLGRRVQELRTSRQLAAEHREIQRSLQQAQQMQSIGEMTSGLSHDFNNVLASMLGFAELGREAATRQGDIKLKSYFGEIERAGNRGADLVRQLRVYSQGSGDQIESVDIAGALADAASLLRGTLPPSVTIEVRDSSVAGELFINRSQLQQILVNLGRNAAEAMSNRGRIALSAKREQLSDARCSSCLNPFEGDMLTLCVEDEGPGLTGKVDTLFQPFRTSKAVGEGSGLGLSVVHGIAHEVGGHVRAGNRAQGGARFSVHLPAEPKRLLQQDGAIASTPRILIVEDEAAVARYLSELFEARGFHVDSFSHGTEALQQFAANPDAFDIVISDQVMPIGSGLELATDMLGIRPDLPVIILTGDPGQITDADVVRSGIKAVMGKPIERDRLLAKVRALVEAKSTGQTASPPAS